MVSSFFFSVLEVLCLVAAVSGSEKAATTTTTTTRSLRAEDPRYLDNSRIVGGDQLNAVDVPQYRSYAIPTAGSLCGGTLVHPDILVTAAHCQHAFAGGKGQVYIGATHRYPWDWPDPDAVETLDVDIEFLHPDYNSMSRSDPDIMLVRLTNSSTHPVVEYNDQSAVPSNDETVRVIGFGRTSEGGSLSETLQQVTLDVVDSDACRKAYPLMARSKTDLCAASPGKDSCQGDSGGPVLNKAGVLVGLVSWGEGCARPDRPSVNTRISAYAEFVRSGICELSADPPASCAPKGRAGECPAVYRCSRRLFLGNGVAMRRRIFGRCVDMCVTFADRVMELAGWECGTCP